MATSPVQPLLLLALVSFFVSPTLGAPVLKCNLLNDYDVKVSDLKYTPDPVKYNGTIQVTITANSSIAISNATTLTFKSWSSASVETYKTPHSLCDVTKCPVKAGPLVLTFSNHVPSDVFSGLFVSASVSMAEQKANAKEMMCVNFFITLDRT